MAHLLQGRDPMSTIPVLDVPAAGAKANVGEGKTADCLKFEQPPTTPHEVKKYRKSFYGEPGTRVIHPGTVDDVIRMRAQLDSTTFGATSGKCLLGVGQTPRPPHPVGGQGLHRPRSTRPSGALFSPSSHPLLTLFSPSARPRPRKLFSLRATTHAQRAPTCTSKT